MGYTYTKFVVVVYFKFKFNWESCTFIKFGNPISLERQFITQVVCY